MVERLGFFRQGSKKMFSISYERLAYYLNKGVKIKKSILKYIY
jgi:ribosomal protein S16